MCKTSELALVIEGQSLFGTKGHANAAAFTPLAVDVHHHHSPCGFVPKTGWLACAQMGARSKPLVQPVSFPVDTSIVDVFSCLSL